MYYYIMAFLLSIIFMNRYAVTNQKKYIILSLLPIITISGFRYDVGTDYMFRYYPDFKSIQNGIIPYNLEIGYLLLVRICLLLSNNFQLVMLATSAFIYGIIYYIIIKKSVSKEISIIIFLLGGFYFDSLNIIRQYMAIVLLLLCFYKLAEDKVKYSLLYLAMAITLHNTALIFVFIYIPYILKFNIKNIRNILVLGLIATPICKPTMNILLRNTRFKVYFEGDLSYYTQGDLQLVLCFLNVIIFLVLIYIIKSDKKIIEDNTAILFLFAQSMAVLLNIFTGFMFIAFRFTYMFSILQVFAVPYFIGQIHDQKIKKKMYIIVMLVYIICLTYLVILNNGNEVLPYRAKLFVS